ncbi:Hsp20/alpha crystallin family protein [Marinoscillum sp.]|uniref:Hsp20/alpha crystallin family protein n=1 Tax=Marinoscillum sp. TaxID=2024838 RepID=UPI003BA94AC6
MRVEDRILIKNLAQTAEIVNTINGGMTQASMLVDKGEDEWTVMVRVPGVSPERMKIEVRDGQLFIFHVMADENAAAVELPFMLAALALDKRVDFDGIMAEYEDKELYIHLPLDEEANGYEREIEIFKR